MKKKLCIALVLSLTVLSGCAVETSTNLDVNENDHLYTYDGRTGICYSLTASMQGGLSAWAGETSGLGKSGVACTDKVLALAGVNKGRAVLNQFGHVVKFE